MYLLNKKSILILGLLSWKFIKYPIILFQVSKKLNRSTHGTELASMNLCLMSYKNKTFWSQQTEFKCWLCYFLAEWLALCLSLHNCNIDPIYKIIKRINQLCLFRTSFSVCTPAPPKGGFQNYKPQITTFPICVQSFN